MQYRYPERMSYDERIAEYERLYVKPVQRRRRICVAFLATVLAIAIMGASYA